jgi:hypothetical protein
MALASTDWNASVPGKLSEQGDTRDPPHLYPQFVFISIPWMSDGSHWAELSNEEPKDAEQTYLDNPCLRLRAGGSFSTSYCSVGSRRIRQD